ncbi:MAG: hypothetical protein IH623_14725 [Verrucomicrobia bacterium]|nr:hypothetical protein [Verrucomicrobiota bacterium]
MDSAHYLRLSRDGYEVGSPSCAFYPLWPAVLRVGTVITGNRPVLAAVLLANALSLVGLWLLYRLVERRCGAAVSRDSLILLLAFPGALFFSFPYTESLYLVLLMLFFWSLELRRWWWLALAGFLLPLARPVGVFIVLPLAWFLFEQWRNARSHEILESDSRVEPSNRGSRRESAPASSGFRWSGLTSAATKLMGSLHEFGMAHPRHEAGKAGASGTGVPPVRIETHGRDAHATTKFLEKLAAHRHWLLLLCPLLGYATYFGTMYAWTGNALEGFEAQRSYPNSPSIRNMFNVAGFANAFANIHTLDGMLDAALDRGFFLLFLALLPAVWKVNRTWFWYTLPTGLLPALSNYFLSYRRFIMVCFPLFVVLAQMLAKGPRWMFWYYVVLLAAMQAWAVTRFVNFNWAG